MKEVSERQQFFIDRIGKRVFRNNIHCPCEICQAVYKNGLIIDDRFHGIYLYDNECDYNGGGYPLRYFDTIEERDEWESSHPWPEDKTINY